VPSGFAGGPGIKSVVVVLLALLTGYLLRAAGPAPEFYLIERFGRNAVLVHFDTQAFRRYELKFSTNGAAPRTRWSTIYTVDAFPFDDHFIVYHEMTNGPAGFYRLEATP
jgi:hypothetical protein